MSYTLDIIIIMVIMCTGIDSSLAKFGWEQVLHHLQRTYDRAEASGPDGGYREVQVRLIL